MNPSRDGTDDRLSPGQVTMSLTEGINMSRYREQLTLYKIPGFVVEETLSDGMVSLS